MPITSGRGAIIPSVGEELICSTSIVVATRSTSSNCVHRKTAALVKPVKVASLANRYKNILHPAETASTLNCAKLTLSQPANNDKSHLAQLRGRITKSNSSVQLMKQQQQQLASDLTDIRFCNLVSSFRERGQKMHPTTRHRHHYKRTLQFSQHDDDDDTDDQPTFNRFSGNNRFTCSNAAAYRRSSWLVVVGSILLCVLILSASSGLSQLARADSLSPSSGITKTGNDATIAYSEPIKWSFGGWAPLDGSAQPSGGKQNSSLSSSSAGARQASSTVATSPMPPAQRTTARPTIASGTNRQQQVESLSESASSARENVHFSAPQHQQQPQPQQQHHHHHHHHHHHKQQGRMHAQLPAYAMPMPERPQQFSAPAPLPIFRDQLLPTANHNKMSFSRPNFKQHHRQQHPMHLQAAMMAAAQQHHQQIMAGPPGIQMRPTALYNQQQQHMQQQHRQHMMQHQQMMHHQQMRPRPPHHQPMQQQQVYRQPHMMDMGAQGQRSIPHYPGSPLMHPPNAPQHQQHGQAELPQAPVGAYKVIEGEQPIIFTNSLAHERIPMIEVSAQGGYKNSSETTGDQQDRPAEANGPGAEQLYSSTLAAIEKDNLNYQNALRQVSNFLSEEQQQQSNNIQDIKQRQQQQQYEQKAHNNNNNNKLANDKPSGSKPSYLTIPVAVETEGDKVLTSDDINEIEKHVINVLPSLKTADKIVKIADAHLTLANLKPDVGPIQPLEQVQVQTQEHQQQAPNQGQELHQMNYEEHRSTLKQLEGDINQQQQQKAQYEVATTPASASTGYRTSPYMSQATTTNQQQPQPQPQEQVDPIQQQQPQQILAEHQYFVATGPLQEVGTIDPDQVADYNLIKNDLLNNLRYEPTRASSSSAGNQQQGITPPMPYQAVSAQRAQPQPQPQAQQQYQEPFNRPSASSGPASVTRYFQQGNSLREPQRGNNLFARLNGPRNQQHNQLAATTRTIMGGRKVSEVMRPLIHTTPVPMTSPLHVPSVEPEKVDAIQLIAGQANDKRPMVVEAHQLVNHTPDGGIDYNSGMSSSAMMVQHHQRHQSPPVDNQLQNQTHNNHLFGQQQQQQQQQQQAGDNRQVLAQYDSAGQDGDNQGAIIEYVAMSDQALSNAVQNQQAQQQQQQQQQRHPEPDNNNNNNQAPFLYDYTMSTQHQSSLAHAAQPPTTPTYLVSGPAEQQQQQVQPETQPSLAWSPSVASEHQQQQLELSEHAAPMHQMDLPATAGYNLFAGQQETLPPANNGQPQQHQQQQFDHYEHQQDAARWRTRAGGSQPNPDAQYDGQIVKSPANEQEAPQNSQQQYAQSQELGRLNSRPQEEHEQQQQQQQQQSDIRNDANADGYQQQQQRYQNQPPSVQGNDNNGEQQQEQRQQQPAETYLTTSSFVGGAQMNEPAPSHGNYEQASQQHQQQQEYAQTHPPTQEQYTYMKLDRDRQQTHLQQHQAQHQAQLAEMMAGQQPSSSYQTTTPISITTLAAIEQQEAASKQQEQDSQQQQQQQQQQQDVHQQVNGNQNGYMVEQVQSRPSVQSGPDSMLVNESPIQMPILDQQSLIADQNQDSNEEFSDDDAAKQRQQSQPAGVYQVYQAYYAPKDHKPLPGYVRLSLDEFNELFRDAEIQYVDRSLNGLAGNSQRAESSQPQQHQQQAAVEPMPNGYEQQAAPSDMMKASASESQSILVDRRSIAERRSFNSTELVQPDAKSKLGRAVKKIISIRNSRQLAKQVKVTTTSAPTTISGSSSKSSTVIDPIKANTSRLDLKQQLHKQSSSSQQSKRKAEGLLAVSKKTPSEGQQKATKKEQQATVSRKMVK